MFTTTNNVAPLLIALLFSLLTLITVIIALLVCCKREEEKRHHETNRTTRKVKNKDEPIQAPTPNNVVPFEQPVGGGTPEEVPIPADVMPVDGRFPFGGVVPHSDRSAHSRIVGVSFPCSSRVDPRRSAYQQQKASFLIEKIPLAQIREHKSVIPSKISRVEKGKSSRFADRRKIDRMRDISSSSTTMMDSESWLEKGPPVMMISLSPKDKKAKKGAKADKRHYFELPTVVDQQTNVVKAVEIKSLYADVKKEPKSRYFDAKTHYLKEKSRTSRVSAAKGSKYLGSTVYGVDDEEESQKPMMIELSPDKKSERLETVRTTERLDKTQRTGQDTSMLRDLYCGHTEDDDIMMISMHPGSKKTAKGSSSDRSGRKAKKLPPKK